MKNKLSILIVDDKEDNRLLIKLTLKKEGYILYEASNGKEAIKKCKELSPDVILMDAIMPILDGFETTKTIRAIDKFKRISILMITSLSQKDYKLKALECGVDDFISKPFDKHELIARCRAYTTLSQDRKKRKEAEDALKKQFNYLQSIVDSIDDSIMVIKEDYTVELMNDTIKQKLNQENISDIKNLKCYEISHNRSTPCDGKEHKCPLTEVLQTKQNVTVVHNHSSTDKKEFVELAATPYFDENNDCVGIIELGRDITTHVELQYKLDKQKSILQHQAYHDNLTGLANRALFDDRLNQGIKKAKRAKTKLALFFIDLDKFKAINDTLGHEAGDEVLITTAKRIKQNIREEDTISRIGGDEFTIIMEHITKKDNALKLAQKIMDAVIQPIIFENNTLNISASIGISIYPTDDIDPHTLLKYADMAMYKAKEKGRNNVQFY